MLASRRGHARCVLLLLEHGADVHQHAADKSTALTAALATGQVAVLQLLLEHGAGDEGGHSPRWMGLGRRSVAAESVPKNSLVPRVLRSYESQFRGSILNKRGCTCVASWPGIYAKSW